MLSTWARQTAISKLSRYGAHLRVPKGRHFSEPAATTNNLLLKGSATKSLGNVTRHGPGDACIVLNVGGTEFITLRSTVAQNPVLSDHVARAEANGELMQSATHKSVSAVFIDRDGAQFGYILQYLRNQVELQNSSLLDSGNKKSSKTVTQILSAFQTKSNMPALPKDGKVLAELYVEAVYYGLTELQSALQDQNTWTKIVQTLGLSKQGNPFVRASQLLAQARMMLVTLGTVTAGGIMSGTEAMNKFLERCGLKQAAKEETDNEESLLALERGAEGENTSSSHSA